MPALNFFIEMNGEWAETVASLRGHHFYMDVFVTGAANAVDQGGQQRISIGAGVCAHFAAKVLYGKQLRVAGMADN